MGLFLEGLQRGGAQKASARLTFLFVFVWGIVFEDFESCAARAPKKHQTLHNPSFLHSFRGRKLNTSFFLKLFGHLRDIPANIPGHPAKKSGLRGLRSEGHTDFFGPHPFTWKTPTPPEDIQTKKFGFGLLFLLII